VRPLTCRVRGRIVSPSLIILLSIALLLVLLAGAGAVFQRFGAARDRRLFPPLGRMVEIGDCRLHLIASGEGRPGVIFESGISATCLNWTHVRTEVSRFTRTIAYDRASLGWSDAAKTPRLASHLVEELHRLMIAAEVASSFILVGHSFGGLIVQMYAANYPERVSGLVLLDPLSASEWMNAPESQLRMLRRGVLLSKRGAVLARLGLVRLSLTLLSRGGRRIPKAIAQATSGNESFISRLVGEVQKMPPEVWPIIQAHWCQPKSFTGMAAYLESLPASSQQAAAVILPSSLSVTIISAGNSTAAQLAERDQMAARSSHGRHIIAPTAGHWVHLDDPNLVIQEIQAMLAPES